MPVLMEWNGVAWANVTQPVAALFSVLQSVSCAGPSFCVAVGFSGTSRLLAIETWNGATWSTSSSRPRRRAGRPSSSTGLARERELARRRREQFDDDGNEPAERDVERFHLAARPAPRRVWQLDQLNAVSCVTASFCLAVGQQGASPTPAPLADEWNGSVWLPVTAAAGPGTLGNEFSSVSCAGTSFFAPVGSSTTPGTGPPSTTFVETWNGSTLAVTPSPNPTSSDIASWSGVACFGPTSCSAAGASGQCLLAVDVAPSWNGSSRSIVGSPNGPASAPPRRTR